MRDHPSNLHTVPALHKPPLCSESQLLSSVSLCFHPETYALIDCPAAWKDCKGKAGLVGEHRVAPAASAPGADC